ncbi:MAG: hypothetical protein RL320_1761 [Pseudomonadota bacterium]
MSEPHLNLIENDFQMHSPVAVRESWVMHHGDTPTHFDLEELP